MPDQKSTDQHQRPRQALSAPYGSVPPTIEELHKALDELHITCECAHPDIRDWYLSDPFAKEARQNAIEILSRYFYSQNIEDSRAKGVG